jgi:rhodanese-related sulfurtransferase
MSFRRLSPAEAKQLMDEQGYQLVDVRSVPEFDAGHPKGAFNVPLNHAGPAGMVPNADFVRVMEASFPKDAKLVVACKAGGRSMKAATLLNN